MRVITAPGVFAPRSDTWMLARTLESHGAVAGADVLDLGTGSGVLAVTAALAGAASVTAVDLSRRALLCAALNARLNGARIRTCRGDLFAAVAGERFDLVVSNPPYLPSASIPRRGAARAWQGGAGGRAILERLCAQVGDHLRPGGTVLIMQSSVNGVSRTLDALEQSGLRADVVARERGPLGPLMRDAVDAAVAEEELYVVRGRRGGYNAANEAKGGRPCHQPA